MTKHFPLFLDCSNAQFILLLFFVYFRKEASLVYEISSLYLFLFFCRLHLLCPFLLKLGQCHLQSTWSFDSMVLITNDVPVLNLVPIHFIMITISISAILTWLLLSSTLFCIFVFFLLIKISKNYKRFFSTSIIHNIKNTNMSLEQSVFLDKHLCSCGCITTLGSWCNMPWMYSLLKPSQYFM